MGFFVGMNFMYILTKLSYGQNLHFKNHDEAFIAGFRNDDIKSFHFSANDSFNWTGSVQEW